MSPRKSPSGRRIKVCKHTFPWDEPQQPDVLIIDKDMDSTGHSDVSAMAAVPSNQDNGNEPQRKTAKASCEDAHPSAMDGGMRSSESPPLPAARLEYNSPRSMLDNECESKPLDRQQEHSSSSDQRKAMAFDIEVHDTDLRKPMVFDVESNDTPHRIPSPAEATPEPPEKPKKKKFKYCVSGSSRPAMMKSHTHKKEVSKEYTDDADQKVHDTDQRRSMAFEVEAHDADNQKPTAFDTPPCRIPSPAETTPEPTKKPKKKKFKYCVSGSSRPAEMKSHSRRTKETKEYGNYADESSKPTTKPKGKAKFENLKSSIPAQRIDKKKQDTSGLMTIYESAGKYRKVTKEEFRQHQKEERDKRKATLAKPRINDGRVRQPATHNRQDERPLYEEWRDEVTYSDTEEASFIESEYDEETEVDDTNAVDVRPKVIGMY